MKLHEVLSRSSLLQAQQDFIDVFPDSWTFKLGPDGLTASVEDDEPMWYNGETYYIPRLTHTKKEAETHIKAKMLENYKIKITVYTRAPVEDSAVPGRNKVVADIGFESYADAFKYFIDFNGGWKGYGSNGTDHFTADDIWRYINELTRS